MTYEELPVVFTGDVVEEQEIRLESEDGDVEQEKDTRH